MFMIEAETLYETDRSVCRICGVPYSRHNRAQRTTFVRYGHCAFRPTEVLRDRCFRERSYEERIRNQKRFDRAFAKIEEALSIVPF